MVERYVDRRKERKSGVTFKSWKKNLGFLLVWLCFFGASIAGAAEPNEPEEQTPEAIYPVPPPLIYRGLFPCHACHRKAVQDSKDPAGREKSFLGKYLRAPNPTPRILVRNHGDIDLNHGEHQWCLNCHNKDHRNYLKMVNNDIIAFEESYLLCGQCHGVIYQDWKSGIHGRRVGQWNGEKLYMLCVHCHDPHNPKFRQIMAEDPPRLPSYGRWGSKD